MSEPNHESNHPAGPSASPAPARPARAARVAVAAFGMVLMAAWAVLATRDELARARWDAFAPTPEAPLFADFARLASLRSPDALIESGRTLEHDLFPARYEEAGALYARAVAVDPLSAGAWFGLAHARLMRGEFDGARAALERSDELDPHYPRRRHASIAMWSALGEPERGLDAARRLARLGGRYRAEAGARLAEAGVPPATIARELTRDAGPLSEEDRVSLAEAIAPATASELEEVAGVLDLASVRDPEALGRAARLAADPLAFDLAFALIRARDPAAEVLAGRVAIANPTLARAPLDSGFPFGWLPLAARTGLEVRWSGPDGADGGGGALSISFSPALRREDFRAPILRTPARAGGGFRIEVRMRQNPPQARPASLLARGGDGRALARAELRSITGASELLRLDVPASDRDETLELVLIVPAAPSDRAAAEIVVEIGGIESIRELDHPDVGGGDAEDASAATSSGEAPR